MDRLRAENPWWKTQSIAPQYAQLRRRLYYAPFAKVVKNITLKWAILLIGPRRVGKTVLMFHIIADLLERTPPGRIIFISLDNPIYINMGLQDLLDLAQRAGGLEDLDGAYIFFDEI